MSHLDENIDFLLSQGDLEEFKRVSIHHGFTDLIPHINLALQATKTITTISVNTNDFAGGANIDTGCRKVPMI